MTAGAAPGGLAALQAHLAGQGVHTVLAQFTDLHGVPKGKYLPLDALPGAVAEGAGFAGPSIWGTGLPRMGPTSEYMGRVVPTSLQPLPFMPGVAHAVCDGYAGGRPLATCSRQVLKRQVDRLAERGWTLWVGVEPEFFLLHKGPEGRWVTWDDQDQLDKPSYDLKSLGRRFAFLEDMRRHLLALGFGWQQTDHEDAPGQYEINYRHDHALAAADRYQLFKLTAHHVAEQHGATFSAVPKPLAGAPGRGLHFHLSLTDADGQALIANPSGAMGLSEVGAHFAAGLLHHADALAALCAPTVNSYRRLAVGRSASGTTWSPVWKTVGENNRTCLVRTVAGRLEWRLPDPSCNIYLALAATLAAGLEGIDRALPAPVPCTEDLYQRHVSGAPMPGRLPRDLHAALEALAADTALRDTLGFDVCERFMDMKWQEWDAYQLSVSDWEWRRYADFF